MQQRLAHIISLILLLAPVANAWSNCCVDKDAAQSSSLEISDEQASPCPMHAEMAAETEQLSDAGDCMHGGHCCSAVFSAVIALPSLLTNESVEAPRIDGAMPLQQIDLAGLTRPPSMS
ncbi:MAG: hypothetical protein ACSHXK_09835 [Oceanococcus sp.]